MKSKIALLIIVFLVLTVVPQAASAQGTPDMSFVADVTIPDDTVMEPGQVFTKTWRLKNSGDINWTEEYSLVFVEGDQLNATSPQPLPDVVKSGDTVDLEVEMIAPEIPGTYTSWWQLQDEAGDLFGSKFYVRIVVKDTADSAAHADWSRWESKAGDWSVQYPPEWYLSDIDTEDSLTLSAGGTEYIVAIQVEQTDVLSQALADPTQEAISVVQDSMIEDLFSIVLTEATYQDAVVWPHAPGGVYMTAVGILHGCDCRTHILRLFTPSKHNRVIASMFLSPAPVTEQQQELLGQVLSTVTVGPVTEPTVAPQPTPRPAPTQARKPSLATNMQGIDASKILNSTVGEIEQAFGDPIDAFSISIGSLPHLPNGGETRMYGSGQYTFYVDYDRNGKAKGFQVIDRLTGEGHKLQHWGVVLTKFGMDVYLPPDVEAPFASHWDDFQGYKISLDADPKSKNVAMVSITKNP